MVGNAASKPGKAIFNSEYCFQAIQISCKCAMSVYLLRWYDRQIFIDIPRTLTPAAKMICVGISEWPTGNQSYSSLGVRYGLDYFMVLVSHICSRAPRLDYLSIHRKTHTITNDRAVDYTGRQLKYGPFYKLEEAGTALKQAIEQLTEAISETKELPEHLRRQAKTVRQMCEGPMFDVTEIVHDLPLEERKGRGRPPKEQKPPALTANPAVDLLLGNASCSKTLNTNKSTAFKSTFREIRQLSDPDKTDTRRDSNKRKAIETSSQRRTSRKASQKALTGILRNVSDSKEDEKKNEKMSPSLSKTGQTKNGKQTIRSKKTRSSMDAKPKEKKEEGEGREEGEKEEDNAGNENTSEEDDFIVDDDENSADNGEDASYIPESTGSKTDSTIDEGVIDTEEESGGLVEEESEGHAEDEEDE